MKINYGSKKKARKQAFIERKQNRQQKLIRQTALSVAIEKGDFSTAIRLMK